MNHHPKSDKKEIAEFQSFAGNSDFDAAIDRDFGSALEGQRDGVSRRRWLQLMGASLALGGAAGCRYQEEKIAAFAFRPAGRVPGAAEHFATMIDFAGIGQPLLSTGYDGRPTKLDGNPKHPCTSFDLEKAKFGASSTFNQARILEFYDPDRLRSCLRRGDREGVFEETTAESVSKALLPLFSGSDLSKVAILAAPSSSPTLDRMRQDFTQRGGTWVTYSAVNTDNSRAGCEMAFGRPLRPLYRFDQAKVIVTLDADPLMLDPGGVANSISFSKGRDADGKQMSRLYAIESQYSTTGAAADHRMSVPSHKIAGFAAAMLVAVREGGLPLDKSLPYRQRLMAAMVSDLLENKGAGIIIAGEKQPPEVHALVHALNEGLFNNNKTIQFIEVADPGQSSLQGISELAEQVRSGALETLVILGGNPVYDAPRELKLGELIRGVKNSLHLTTYKNETSLQCGWVVNAAHPLETWKDGIAYDGSALVGQPLIDPIFGGNSEIEWMARLLGEEVVSGQQLVRKTLGLVNEQQWKRAVHDGFVAGSQPQPVEVFSEPTPDIPVDDSWSRPWDESSLELVFNPSLNVYDGQFANNSWMLELPNFMTKICWDNVVNVSPKTAAKLGLKQQMLVTLNVGGVEQQLPVNIQPGQADGSLGVDIGWGRTAAGRVGGDALAGVPSVGFDVNNLRKVEGWNFVGGLGSGAVKPSRTNYKLAVVQEPWEIDKTGRDEIQARMFRDKNKNEGDRSSLLREGTFASYLEFLAAHPLDGKHDHHSSIPNTRPAIGKSGELPIIGQVSYAGGGDEHEHHWPEAFHSHHALFDLTEGVREEYKEDNPENRNVWGKTIDLNKCTGCNACVVACQAENNVPVVGKEEAWRGREMHWIRIDRYYGDNLYTDDAAENDDKVLVHQPVACMHCENAPCETVCPVAATVHSSEGLNDMIYNRCIGTRYCGNNCPYKVRRFNYLNYSDAKTFIKYPGADKLPPADLAFQSLVVNPEVTVRSRGVMEKCTYCVQRIQNTKILAKNQRRPIGPNEVTTACQDACPSGAIEFGDLNHPESRVYQKKKLPRAYVMLEDLNNYPRTKYLARVRNAHPLLIDRDDRNSVKKRKKAAKKADVKT
jgi:Fe-S-cluster-containing dehydrogenase component